MKALALECGATPGQVRIWEYRGRVPKAWKITLRTVAKQRRKRLPDGVVDAP